MIEGRRERRARNGTPHRPRCPILKRIFYKWGNDASSLGRDARARAPLSNRLSVSRGAREMCPRRVQNPSLGAGPRRHATRVRDKIRNHEKHFKTSTPVTREMRRRSLHRRARERERESARATEARPRETRALQGSLSASRLSGERSHTRSGKTSWKKENTGRKWDRGRRS